MKKLLVLILVVAMSMVSLIVCTNEATNDVVGNSSEAVSVETESQVLNEEDIQTVLDAYGFTNERVNKPNFIK